MTTLNGPILDSIGAPVTGRLVVEQTETFTTIDGWVSTARVIVAIVAGELELELPISVGGTILRLTEEFDEHTTTVRHVHITDASNVDYGDLTDVAPPGAPADSWIEQLLDAANDIDIDAAQVAADRAAIEAAIASIPSELDTDDAAIAALIGVLSSATRAALAAAFQPLINPASPGAAFSPWTTYAPTFTGFGWAIGNGTITAAFTLIGKTVHFRGRVVIGSTTSFGSFSPSIGLPFESLGNGLVGATLIDAGSNYFGTICRIAPSSSKFEIYRIGPDGVIDGFTGTHPFALAAGDSIEFAGTYERV